MKFATTLLMLCVAALLATGFVMLYSSSMVQKGMHLLIMQLIWCLGGLVPAGVALSMDYRRLKKLALPIFILAVILLALVLVPSIGAKRSGARRWFDLGVFSLQPSELGKLGLILILAWWGDKFHKRMDAFWKGFVFPGLLALGVLVLIFVEPDRGSTILLAAVTFTLLAVAGTRWRFLIPTVILGVLVVGYSFKHDRMRMGRIASWLHPEETKTGVGYQAWQATVALGAGGTTGLGLGRGLQKLGYVPEHQTDFIFAVVGEELGLAATLGVLGIYALFVLCGAYIAANARDKFGTLLATGITFLVGCQAFINIGVVTSTLPNKGLPLPFISYGGSNLVLMLVCAGILLSVGWQSLEASTRAAEDDSDSADLPEAAMA